VLPVEPRLSIAEIVYVPEIQFELPPVEVLYENAPVLGLTETPAASTVTPAGFFTVMETLSAWPGAGLTDPAIVYACVPEKDEPGAGLENDTEPEPPIVSVNDV
jgi:hypothetical protein